MAQLHAFFPSYRGILLILYVCECAHTYVYVCVECVFFLSNSATMAAGYLTSINLLSVDNYINE